MVKGGEVLVDAESRHAQALDLYRAGSLKEAVEEFEKSRSLFNEQGDVLGAASVANDLGVVYYLLERREDAMHVLEEALAVFEQRGNVLGQAKATGNLAQLLNRSGDKAAAEKRYLHAAELFHEVGEKALEYDTYRALSQMQLQRGRILEALAVYDRALAAKGGSALLRAFLQIPLRLAGVRR